MSLGATAGTAVLALSVLAASEASSSHLAATAMAVSAYCMVVLMMVALSEHYAVGAHVSRETSSPVSARKAVLDSASLQLLFDEVRRQQADQRDHARFLTGRAQQTLGFSGVMLGLLFTLRSTDLSTGLVIAFIAGGLALFVATATTAWPAWTLLAWRSDPNVFGLQELVYVERWRFDSLRDTVTSNRLEALRSDSAKIRKKVRLLRIAQALLVAQVVYLIATAVVASYLN